MTLTSNELAQYSSSVQRTLGLPRPKWRGVLHHWAFWVSIPVGIVATVLAGSWFNAFAVAVFASGVSAMLGISARVHKPETDPKKLEVLFQWDHSGIFYCMATGATAIGLLGLEGNRRIILLSVYWAGALVGLATIWLSIRLPRGVTNTIYLAIGWTALPMGPALLESSGVLGLTLLLVGAGFYSVGALIVGFQWPDPNPHVFGYHEIWHVMVVIAAAIHYVYVAIVLAHL